MSEVSVTEKEDKFLLASIEDKVHECIEYGIPSNTFFLDMRQQTLVDNLCKSLCVNYTFDGGYDDAERRICVFTSDYIEVSEPLIFLRVASDSIKSLTHRDYLGSLMGLGIKRHFIGDILVNKNGADIIVLSEIGKFLLSSLDKVGNTPVKVTETTRDDLYIPEQSFITKKDTVSTLRLDSVTATAFSTSRSVACEYIQSGKVYLNGRQIIKNDAKLSEGDKIVIRGKGKAILREVGGYSKKDRIFITIEKYI